MHSLVLSVTYVKVRKGASYSFIDVILEPRDALARFAFSLRPDVVVDVLSYPYLQRANFRLGVRFHTLGSSINTGRLISSYKVPNVLNCVYKKIIILE